MGTSLAEEQYHLRWNDYHSSLTKCFRDLRDNDEMLDVTIISDGRTFKAHKLVLSACSPMFKGMLKKARGQQLPFLQPIVFLHGVRHEDIEAILDFMYNGEVSVNQADLRSFLTVAEDLRVRGLTQMDLEHNKKTDSNNQDNINIPSDEDDDDERSRSPIPRPPASSEAAGPVVNTIHHHHHNHPQHRSSTTETNLCRATYNNVMTENEINRKRRRSLDDVVESSGLDHKRAGTGFGNLMNSTVPIARDYSMDHSSAHSSPFHQAFSVGASPPHLARRASNSMEPHGNVSFHRLGGRDHGDPLCNVMVTRSDKGWHCPECIHVATTKGNLKSHILSGRHKLSEKSFKCRFCDRSYSTRQSMQVHISTNHRQERDLEIKPNINDLIPAMAGDPVVMDTPGYPPGSNHHEAHHAARFGVDHGVDHAGVDQHGQHGGPVNHGMDRMDRIERERMNRLDQVVDRLNRVDRENLERADHQRGNHLEQQQHVERDDHLEHDRLERDRMEHDQDHNVEPQPSYYPPSHSEDDTTPPHQTSPPRAAPQGVLMPHHTSPPPRAAPHLPSSAGGGPQGAMLSPTHHSNSHPTYTSTPNIITTDSLPSANAYEEQQQPLN